MASPDGRHRLASTFDWCGQIIQTVAYDKFDPEEAQVLDVGAGWGKYRDLLPDFQMDAVEVWEPYIREEKLRERYRNVWPIDVVDFAKQSSEALPVYDLVIFGDVLEHLSRSDAQHVLNAMLSMWHDVEFLVAVPFLHEQGEEDGNPYEVHVQDDLTPEVMARELPQLRLIAMESVGLEPFKGVYRRAL